MNKPFKFRFVNEMVGVFVLLAALVFVVAIFLAGRAQGLFEPKFKVHSVFTSEEGAYGLKKGAEVKIRDTVAGTVKRVRPNADGAIQATYELQKSYHPFVRSSSRAVIKKTFVLTGDSYVEIRVGNPKDPLIPDGGMIESIKDTEIIEMAMKVLEDIRAATVPAFEKFQLFLNELPALAVQVRATLHETELVLHDDVPGLTFQAQGTLREIQTLIEGLQRHWLLRQYMEPQDNGLMIAPSAVRSLTPPPSATTVEEVSP